MTDMTVAAHPPEGVRPVSATHPGVALAGLVAFVLAVLVLRVIQFVLSARLVWVCTR